MNKDYQTIINNLCQLQTNLKMSDAQFAITLGTNPPQWNTWKNLKVEVGFTRCGELLNQVGEKYAIKTDLKSWMLSGFIGETFVPNRVKTEI